jgi:hypothetical protein
MESQHISLDIRSYTPKTIPDEDNFAMAPVVRDWMGSNEPAVLRKDFFDRVASHITRPTNYSTGHRNLVDLAAWQQAAEALGTNGLNTKRSHLRRGFMVMEPEPIHFATDKSDAASRAGAAARVLEEMKPDAVYFDALRAASSRSGSRFPVQYDLDDPLLLMLPHLARVNEACDRLQLMAIAELAAAQTDQALSDVKLLFYIGDSLRAEPSLNSFRCRLGIFQSAIQPIWEGLVENRWTESQLGELQAYFERCDLLNDVAEKLKYERAFQAQVVEVVRKDGLGFVDDFGYNPDLTVRKALWNVFGYIMPRGWFDLEKLNCCESFDQQVNGFLRLSERRIAPDPTWGEISIPMDYWPPGNLVMAVFRHKTFATIFNEFEIVKLTASSVARAQTTADEAAIACALERYRLANGEFPEKLTDLAPRFVWALPNDLLSGQPYKYSRTGDGRFLLYSVGWNGKDDGGVSGDRLFDPKNGDWVWDCCASQ